MDQSNNQISQETRDRARGCVLGALIGDASGSILEFGTLIGLVEVSHALTLPGGGLRKLGQGQITDDGELTLSLLRALVRCKKKFDLDQVAIAFADWFASKPFDVGNTIRNSIKRATNMKQHQALLCQKAAIKHNQGSQSNGSMMLISPLAAYSVGKGHEFIRQAAFDITSLIHPDETVKLCNTFYVTCMTILIENPKVSRIDAYNQTKEIVKTDNVTFKQWIQEIEDPKQRIPTYPKGGWVRIAFTHSFAIFLEGLSYKESIAKMLMLRGDTDTNGCILGALVGSAVGEIAIDEAMRQKVLTLESTRQGIIRPKFLCPKFAFDELMNTLVSQTDSS